MENSKVGLSAIDSARDHIWDSIRAGAMSEAQNNPTLRDYLYASILSHNSLEWALGFLLANRFHIPTLSTEQLINIFYMEMMKDRGIQRSIRLDLQGINTLMNGGILRSIRQDLQIDPTCASYNWQSLQLEGYQSLQSYRVAHALWNQGYKELALKLQSCISEVFEVDIHPAAKIGAGILLDDGIGLVIGETAVVGNYVSLMNGVILGGTCMEVGDRHPKIGQGATIGYGAMILGNITVGEGAIVSTGSLVLENVPSHSMVAGNPAKIIEYLDENDPSLTLKHDAIKDLFGKLTISSTDGKSNGI